MALRLVQLLLGTVKPFYDPGVILVIDSRRNIWMSFFFFLIKVLVNTLLIGEPAEAEARARASNEDGEIKRVSTKEWAKSTGYDPVKLFTKVSSLPAVNVLFDVYGVL